MASAHTQEVNSFREALLERCENKCELCNAQSELSIFEVPPVTKPEAAKCAMLCSKCDEQAQATDSLDVKHLYCLNDTAWTQVPVVQVLVWRLLKSMTSESWAQDLAEQLYLEDDVKAWAEEDVSGSGVKVVDSNGAVLSEGDTVTVIKDLDVKGTSFVAKRGTVVKNIHLGNDATLVEGRVNGTVIFLKTIFLKKS